MGGFAFVKNLEVVNEFVMLSDANINFTCPLHIINCRFPTSIQFNSLSKVESILIKDCSANYFTFNNVSLKFTGRNFNSGAIILSNINARMQLSFQNTTTDMDIVITDQSKLESCSVTNCEIGRDFYFKNTEVNLNIGTSKTHIKGYLFFEEVKVKGPVTHYNCELQLGISCINNSSFEDIFSISDCIINTKAYDGNSTLSLSNSKFKKNFNINYLNSLVNKGFDNINIHASQFENGFNIDGTGINSPMIIPSVNISCSKLLTGEIFFGNLQINSANITGYNFDAFLVFNKVSFRKLVLNYFSNDGNFQFINTQAISNEDTSLRIENSNLSKTQFLNSSLRGYKTISIRNSTLTGISSSSAEWFTYKQLNIKSSKIEDFKQNREVFRQLKFAMEKQGDKIQSLVFKQYEMMAYRHEIKLSKGLSGEKLIMFFNRSNSYGQNWLKPLAILLGCNIIFYLLLIITQSQQISWTIGTNLSFVYENIRVFFLILNPAHNIDTLFGEHAVIPWQVYPIDLIYRIIISYLIFQTISAFRKYVK